MRQEPYTQQQLASFYHNPILERGDLYTKQFLETSADHHPEFKHLLLNFYQVLLFCSIFVSVIMIPFIIVLFRNRESCYSPWKESHSCSKTMNNGARIYKDFAKRFLIQQQSKRKQR